VEFVLTGADEVVRLPQWPIFVTRDHRVYRVDPQSIAVESKKQLVYEIISAYGADPGWIVAGPHLVASGREREMETCESERSSAQKH